LRFRRATGSLAPKPHGGGRAAKFSGARLEALRKDVETHPDASLEELLTRSNINGVSWQSTAPWSVWIAALKKVAARRRTRSPGRSRTAPGVVAENFRHGSCLFCFYRRSGAKTNMTRLYARTFGGQRAVDKIPHGHWSTTTMISALRLDGSTADMVLEGATDGDAFRVYVSQVLAPTLKRVTL